MVERSGLRRGGGGSVVCVRGGHEASGEEAEPLDEAAVQAAVAEFGGSVEAFAVAAMFSVRNPAHEMRVRERIRAGCGKPVTCSHELSAQLDAPRARTYRGPERAPHPAGRATCSSRCGRCSGASASPRRS